MHLHEDIKGLFKVVEQLGMIIIPFGEGPEFFSELSREVDHEEWIIICKPDYDEDERLIDLRIKNAYKAAMLLTQNSESIFRYYQNDYNMTTLSGHYDKFIKELGFDIRDYLIIICCR